MCIGIPMQVLRAEPGFATCRGRAETRRVATLLVGDCAPGDWLLVFLDDARSRLDAARAAEVDSALDLLQQALDGAAAPDPLADPGFVLPSSMSAADLAAFAAPTTKGQP